MKQTILITGAAGQIGANLVERLTAKGHSVIATDLKQPNCENTAQNLALNVMDVATLQQIVIDNDVTEIYHLAAILSASGEKSPLTAWEINMGGLLNVLETAKRFNTKVFWPSSIASFGITTPKHNTPQTTITQPNTAYGISKITGELWCEYYYKQYGVDVRSLRFPGLISAKGEPGGGTTDYAVHIFHAAIANQDYTCFLTDDTQLPMLYIDDAMDGIIELMQADADEINIRTSYNIGGLSFTPKELAAELRNHFPNLTVNYEPDFRQSIANTWPASLDDSKAREDWNWKPNYDLKAMTAKMVEILQAKEEKQKSKDLSSC